MRFCFLKSLCLVHLPNNLASISNDVVLQLLLLKLLLLFSGLLELK